MRDREELEKSKQGRGICGVRGDGGKKSDSSVCFLSVLAEILVTLSRCVSPAAQAPFFFKVLMWTAMKKIFTDKNNQEALFFNGVWCLLFVLIRKGV